MNFKRAKQVNIVSMADSKAQVVVSLLVCLLICFGASFLGSQATMQGLQAWYPSLNKPAFNPPSWVFAPVWTVLFFLMSVALWMVWRSPASKWRTMALILFAVQLILNVLWSWLFFAWQNLFGSFVEILCLVVAIMATIFAFSRVRSTAAWLLVPYLAWTGFASFLTHSIYHLNSSGTDGSNIQIQIGERE